MTLSSGILVAITCVGVFLIIVIIFQLYKYRATKIRNASIVNRRSATVAPAPRIETPDHGNIVLASPIIRQPILAVASPHGSGMPHQYSSRSSIATAPPVSTFYENLRRQALADFRTSSTSPAENVHKNAVCEGCLKRLSVSEQAAHKSTCSLVFIECRKCGTLVRRMRMKDHTLSVDCADRRGLFSLDGETIIAIGSTSTHIVNKY